MHRFNFRRGSFYCENLKVKDLAEKFGTPLYLYSSKTILDHFDKIKKAFSSINPLICYSVKANSNLSLLKLLVEEGAGLDIVSGGELYRAKRVRCPAKRIVYASVGKTEDEIKEAIKYGILIFNVESVPELKRIDKIAQSLKKKVEVCLRLNPKISPKTHQYIVTAKSETKFGMDAKTIKTILLNQRAYSNLKIIGLHIHIGSQIEEAKPFIAAINKVKSLLKDLEKQKVVLKYLNIGGGLGIVYHRETPQTAKKFAQKVLPLLKEISLKVILEPGRFIVGSAGVLVTKVLYLKDTPQKRFVIVDAGMNDLIRPPLYGAYHQIVPLIKRKAKRAKRKKLADVVGPICESADFLAKDRLLEVEEGDFLAVMGAGAYGFSMSSNYNSRPRAAEVLVKDKKSYLIRKRETNYDLIAKERVRS